MKIASSPINGPTRAATRARQVRCSRPSYLYTQTTTSPACGLLLSTTLRPVSQELGLSLFRQRVIEQLIDHLERNRRDVGAYSRCFDHVNGISQTRRQNFGFPRVVLIDLDDALQQFETVLADVIEPAEKRADERSTRRASRQTARPWAMVGVAIPM